MKNPSKNSLLVTTLLCFTILLSSCHKKDEPKKEEVKKQATELAVAADAGFSSTHVFPNNVCTPWKDTLANGDIMLHKEIFLEGDIPEVGVDYEVTLVADYYENINIDYANLVVTLFSPDGHSKRTQKYKINFAGSKDEVIGKENGVALKRHACQIFPMVKFSSKGKAKIEVEINAPNAKFSFAGLKAISAKVEKIAQ